MPDTYSPMFSFGRSVPDSRLLSLYQSLGREVGQQGKQGIKRGERERGIGRANEGKTEREREREWGGGRGLDETLTCHSCQSESEREREREREKERDRERERETERELSHTVSLLEWMSLLTHAQTHTHPNSHLHTQHTHTPSHTLRHISLEIYYFFLPSGASVSSYLCWRSLSRWWWWVVCVGVMRLRASHKGSLD